jgi:hypothetical protein
LLTCGTGLLASILTASALDWQPGDGFGSAALSVPAQGRTGFTQLQPAQTGIAFTNHLADNSAVGNQILQGGSGVALGDIDGDGWCDVYLCRIEGPNALYRNLGHWRFEDITGPAGVACAGQHSTGAVLVDVDGDGDLDLLVNAIGGGTRLFFNDGAGRFTESVNAGLLGKSGATSMALADVDGDGDLDLYVANYRTNTIRSTGLQVLIINGKRVLRPQDRDQYEFTPEGLLLEHGEVDALYLNNGKGQFTPVSWTGGAFLDEDGKPLAAGPKEWGLSVMFRDVNGDLAPDLYVCNDFWSPDRFWINDGAGRYRALPRLAQRNSSTFSMGVDFADVNRDGQDDFFVLDMLSRDHARRMRQRAMLGQAADKSTIGQIDDRPQIERNTLFVSRGDGSYAELAQYGGVQASEWSWGVVFVDVDLDGFEDMLITTGHDFDTQDADAEARIAAMGPSPASSPGAKLLVYPRLNVPNAAFRNRRDLTFEEVGQAWGFDAVGVSHGIALADLDNDGDLDVVINNLNAAAGLYRNESIAPRVAVRLKGKAPNTLGIGAKIKVRGGPVPQSQEMIAGGRYLSGDDALRVFAAGLAAQGLEIEVTWRNGTRSIVTGAAPNRIYEIAESGARPAERPAQPDLKPFFREVASFQHTHQEEPFDDFARQRLLSKRFSQLGPGLAWFDVDGDGWEDLMIGSGRGGELAAFRNRQGHLDRLDLRSALGKAADDQTTVLGWSSESDPSTFWVAEANYESGQTNHALRRYAFRAGEVDLKETLPGWGSSLGPVAVADVDGDGDLDLFAGGRLVPGRYPEPATSRLYRNEGGRMQLATEWPGLGLVSGAVFSDLDGDGFAELILAREWGGLKIFRNDHGRLAPWDAPVERERESGKTGKRENDAVPLSRFPAFPLSSLTGWWNGVTTGDFDGDGRLDIIASNWGRNHPWQEFVKDELRVFYEDFAGKGTIEPVEACFNAHYRRLVPWRDLETVAAALPWVRERFPTYQSYGEASLEQIYGERLKSAPELRAHWLETTLFLNRGDAFEARPLPAEAQFAPAFGVCVADFDGDGHEDAFLGQNFFAVEEQTSRYDAGRGLWLRGDGRGGFRAVPGQESGVRVYGEQRGAALCDYDRDGRVDLVVTQNGAATRLFRNELGRPGLRVRLKGPPTNLSGIGAALWLVFGEKAGSAREVHGGSGYWSQDGAVQVLATPARPTRLTVRWPGGRHVDVAVPENAMEIRVDYSGSVERLR